jgi:hypothetical protein
MNYIITNSSIEDWSNIVSRLLEITGLKIEYSVKQLEHYKKHTIAPYAETLIGSKVSKVGIIYIYEREVLNEKEYQFIVRKGNKYLLYSLLLILMTQNICKVTSFKSICPPFKYTDVPPMLRFRMNIKIDFDGENYNLNLLPESLQFWAMKQLKKESGGGVPPRKPSD